MCKICWGILVVVSLMAGAMAYKFIITGETIEASDGRKSLLLEPGERDLVLTEMRMFLASVQKIVLATNEDDSAAVAKAAREVGGAAQQAVPGSLMKKLPLEFKKLGFDTHKKFDQIAIDAEQFGDADVSRKQLAELMQNCIACHAVYRVDSIPVK